MKCSTGSIARIARCAIVACFVLLPGARALAQSEPEVNIQVSSRDTWVGIPFVVRVTVTNGDEILDPTFPEVDGLQVMDNQADRSGSSVTTIVNGRMTRRQSVSFAWAVVPTRAGRFRIPSVEIEVDGQVYGSRPIDINAEASVAGDDVLVDVTSSRDEYYLGEPVPLVLSIRLKQFVDSRSGGTLDAQSMVRCIKAGPSRWWIFEDDLDSVSLSAEKRETKDGTMADYVVVALEGTVVPQVSGPLVVDDVRILVDYPQALESRRDLFGRRSTRVSDSRPVAVAPAPTSITVRPLPEEGRPPTFTGAVGRFTFSVHAAPTDVVVGDPIELTLRVTDLTGDGRLEGLTPPALHLDPALTDGFRVPDEAYPGTVQGRTKVFTQSIRATSEDVTEIPPLSFAYFDPERGVYEVAQSAAIPLSVAPAIEVSLSEVVSAAQPRPETDAAGTTLTAVSGGLVAAYDDPQALLAPTTRPSTTGLWVATGAPPAAWAIVMLVRLRQRRREADPAGVRRRQARGAALRRLDGANGADDVASAVREYVADRLGLAEGAVTTSEVTRRLRAFGVNGARLESIEKLLADCDQAVYAGGGADGDLAARARESIVELEKERLR